MVFLYFDALKSNSDVRIISLRYNFFYRHKITRFFNIFRAIYGLNMQTEVKESKSNDNIQVYKINIQTDRLKILENRIIFRR